MEGAVSFEIKYYVTRFGKKPFRDWLEAIKDNRMRQIISRRVYRVQSGNFGDCKSLGSGVHEMRIHYGPGARMYFGKDKGVIIVLLCGGEKRTQKKDIKRAHEFWQDYKERVYEKK